MASSASGNRGEVALLSMYTRRIMLLYPRCRRLEPSKWHSSHVLIQNPMCGPQCAGKMPARQPARRGATDKDSSVLNSLLFATIFRESAEARASQVAEKRSMGMKTCQGTDSSVPLSC